MHTTGFIISLQHKNTEMSESIHKMAGFLDNKNFLQASFELGRIIELAKGVEQLQHHTLDAIFQDASRNT